MPTTAPSFTILPPKKPPQLDPSRRAECQVTVTNNGRQPIEGRVRVVAKDPAKSEWMTLVEKSASAAKPDSGERTWKVQEQQVFTVAIAIPADAAPGTYRFHVEAYAVQAPEDDCAESAPIEVTIAGAAPAKKPFPIWIPIVAGAGVLAIVGIVLAVVLTRSPKPPAALPSLAGMTVDAATKLLADDGFQAEKAGETRTGKQPAGTVVTQEPAAGASIASGTRVLLVVEASALVVAVHVPQLSGLAQAEAERVLGSLGMKAVVKDTRYVAGRNDGEVLDQQPAPGTYDHDIKEVSIVVQAPSAIVPNLNRQPLATAREALGQLGLSATEIYTSDTLPDVPVGAVVGQLERPGLRVERGSKVTITVNRSPMIKQIDPRIQIDRRVMIEQPAMRKVESEAVRVKRLDQ